MIIITGYNLKTINLVDVFLGWKSDGNFGTLLLFVVVDFLWVAWLVLRTTQQKNLEQTPRPYKR